MKEVVVLSGKGGTGKTSILGSFAALSEKKVMADCDVDAADLHLLLNPRVREREEFFSGQVALIDEEKCTQCGLCEELCRFDAIADFMVDSVACEGCGFCARVCPSSAITMQEECAGNYFVSDTKYGPLVHARLGIAQENSGKLVAQVRKKAKEVAERDGLVYILSDGPPGIGCPVISSISGVNLALLVTEPTLSGIHDLKRVQGVMKHFGIPSAVCINKWDLNEENTLNIERYCSEEGVCVVSKIPYDDVFTEAMVHGLPVVEYSKGPVSNEIERMWSSLMRLLELKNTG
jgi:MinD superfamily P-loop ATPase